ncbi:uncharacterized protein G2W53_043844 [Senna tora]|uniref:Uncharacterized protein n=1 Tax=Senna tora TaxID=362788 RepID=A0A834SLF0_9FABA|nr:uncharacterized protein G2W53_043844 [Senna tora]
MDFIGKEGASASSMHFSSPSGPMVGKARQI